MLAKIFRILLVISILNVQSIILISDFWDRDDIKEDLSAIYSGGPLSQRDEKNISVTEEQIKLYLFTEETSKNYSTTNFSYPIDKCSRIAVIVHGWGEDVNVQWYQDLKNAFLKMYPNYCILEVDWSFLSKSGYLTATYGIKNVGTLFGSFVLNLCKKYSVQMSKFLFVGHSLGAQICSYISEEVKKLDQLSRIIALDPAGVLFNTRPANERLSKDDAEYVEVIHTSGGTAGFLEPCGRIDFFPNGGSIQPGCVADSLNPAKIVACYHARSYEIFIEAVLNPKEFRARKCDNYFKYKHMFLPFVSCGKEYVDIGDLKTKESGNFYLDTNSKPPYSK